MDRPAAEPPHMYHVALTGNIAAGKSSVAALLRSWGVPVIDADALAREVQAPGSPVLAAIVERFGPDILTPAGELDRARLRARVLAAPGERRALERLVHPAVQALRAERVAAAFAAGAPIVVSDIPLLFEVLDPAAFDAVLLVDAPEAVRLARLAAMRGLAPGEARALEAAQLPAAAKRAWRGPRGAAALVIENDGTPAELEARTRAAWAQIRERAAR